MSHQYEIHSLLHHLVQHHNPTNEEFVTLLQEYGYKEMTIEDVIERAIVAGIGLLPDGQWYTHEQSSMVDEATKLHRLSPETLKLDENIHESW
jgi:hypothetical protein